MATYCSAFMGLALKTEPNDPVFINWNEPYFFDKSFSRRFSNYILSI